jgi:hypothetical protein
VPTATYDLLYSNTLSSNTTTVTISGFASSYRDLILVIQGLGSTGDFYPRLQFNSDTGSNYSWQSITSSASVVNAYQSLSETGLQIGNSVYISTGDRALYISNINDYSATNIHKTVITRANRYNLGPEIIASRWANTSAITSIYLYSSNGNGLATGSTINLYGVIS